MSIFDFISQDPWLALIFLLVLLMGLESIVEAWRKK